MQIRKSLSPMATVAPGAFSWQTRSAEVVAASVAQARQLPAPPPCGAVRLQAPAVVSLEEVVHCIGANSRHQPPERGFVAPLIRDNHRGDQGRCYLPGAALAWNLRRQGVYARTAVAVRIEVVLTSGSDRGDTEAGLQAACRDSFPCGPLQTKKPKPLARALLACAPMAWRSLAALRCCLADAEQPVLLWHDGVPVPWSIETLRVPRGWSASAHVRLLNEDALSPRFSAVLAFLSHMAVVSWRREAACEALPVPLDEQGDELPEGPAHTDAGAVAVYDSKGAPGSLKCCYAWWRRPATRRPTGPSPSPSPTTAPRTSSIGRAASAASAR